MRDLNAGTSYIGLSEEALHHIAFILRYLLVRIQVEGGNGKAHPLKLLLDVRCLAAQPLAKGLLPSTRSQR